MKLLLPALALLFLLLGSFTHRDRKLSATRSSDLSALVILQSKKVSIGFCNCPGTECRYGYSADCSAGKSDCTENPCGVVPNPCTCD